MAYAPQPSYDDMAWYGLAFARIHELFHLEGFLRVAVDIFQWCWNNGWDKSGMKNKTFFSSFFIPALEKHSCKID